MTRIVLPLDDIIADYQAGCSSLELATKYGVSKRVILSRLKETNTPRRDLSAACRRNELNTNFFSLIDSERKAYWLGFLLADGNIQPCGRNNKGRMVRIALQERDEKHLQQFLTDIGSSHRLFHDPTKKAFWAKFTSKPFALQLENKGWHLFKKTGDLSILSHVPTPLHRHVVRGLIDGDGCIAKRKRQNNPWILQFVNLHKSVVEWTKNELKGLGIKGEVRIAQPKNNKAWVFSYANSSVPIVLRKLYQKSTISLERKRLLAIEACQSIASQR